MMKIFEQTEQVAFLYRHTGLTSHINITEALDESFHRLDSIENTLSKLEKTDLWHRFIVSLVKY